jgi:hypothetical protein
MFFLRVDMNENTNNSVYVVIYGNEKQSRIFGVFTDRNSAKIAYDEIDEYIGPYEEDGKRWNWEASIIQVPINTYCVDHVEPNEDSNIEQRVKNGEELFINEQGEFVFG